MTGQEVGRAMQFLVEHHAKVSAHSERNSEQIAQLMGVVSLHSEQIKTLASQSRQRGDARSCQQSDRRT